MKETLFWQALRSLVNHRNTQTARRLNVMQHVFDGDVSFEQENNPCGSPLKHLPLFVKLPGRPCEGGTAHLEALKCEPVQDRAHAKDKERRIHDRLCSNTNLQSEVWP